jgi:hypothetical protein
MKAFLFCSFWLSTFFIQAQFTEETTKILDKEQGSPVFVLRGGEQLYSYAPENDWYKVRKKVVVRVVDVEGKLMNPGVTLRNEKGDSIGYTLTELKVKELEKIKQFRGEDYYKAVVEGYVFKTKLEDNSIPEESLTEILKIKNRTTQQEEIDALMQRYSFEERKFDDMVVFVMREEEKTLGEEKDFRIILVYRGGSTLYAVMTNAHTVEAPKVKATWEDGDFKVTYLYKPSAAQKELIEDKILYTYLAL